MTADISRHSLRPLQKFTGVVHQHGRLPLDSEATEASDILTGQLRDIVADAICGKGSPDGGFKLGDVTVEEAERLVDFLLAAGTFFLAGTRLETGRGPVQYRDQPDWLTFPLDGTGATAPTGDRIDLVWLLAWEQVVTATEDSELLEQALGGPDTTARRRLMNRVQVLEDVPDDCADALDELVAQAFPNATLDEDRCAIVSNARLTIGFEILEPLEDLCRPSAQEGFLGARNETFRIQITGADRFVWGRDNAAPLYRVQVSAHDDGTRRKIRFLTSPRDHFAWPLAGMTVEVLRWGALLDNGEKAAEPTGLLLTVETGFDPDDGSIVVSGEIPLEWDQWFATAAGQAAQNERDDEDVAAYFFLRVWTGGGEGTAPDHPMNVGSPVSLGETGLTATFASVGVLGDYWIVSARPNTPTEVTPWALLNSAPPVGPRRLVAPLALLNWKSGAIDKLVDCRNRFRPLCRVGGCCVVTVGDGRHSFGDVTSIQEAVDSLPDEGGEICIHAGVFKEHVTIESRRNITITGCGRHTVWQAENGETAPLLSIVNGSGIVVRRLAMIGTVGECIVASSDASLAEQNGVAMENLLLEDLRLTASDFGAVAGLGGRGYTVRRCRTDLDQLSAGLNDDPDIGRAAAIFLEGEDLTVEHSQIEALDIDGGLRLPVGGIHIGGDSEGVTIRDNVIRGGNGHGITLGSVQYIAEPEVEEEAGESPSVDASRYTNSPKSYGMTAPTGMSARYVYYGQPIAVGATGCIKNPGTAPVVTLPEDSPIFPESGGLVRFVRIERNLIADMGYSGISAHVFAGLGPDADTPGDAIAVESAEIFENTIQGCMRNEIGDTTPLLRLLQGWGGIALSICSDVTIRDNIISGNGIAHDEPICGIFLAVAEDVRIERNRIEQNGRIPQDGQQLNPGRRGGIVIGIAIGGLSTYGEGTQDAALAQRDVDRPALVVNGNMVQAPAARALKAILLGPGMILGNRFTGEGRSALMTNVFGSLVAAGLSISVLRGQLFDPKAEIDLLDYVLLELLSDVLGGDAVNVVNLCVAEDLVTEDPNETDGGAQRLRGGETMFNDNQVSLRPHSAEQAVNVSSVLLLSSDDLSVTGNQFEVENEIAFVLTNILVLGGSIRVLSNRMQERFGAAILSAITGFVMNDTSHNQTTHCILAVGWPSLTVRQGNTSILGALVPSLCELVEALADAISDGLGASSGTISGQ